MKVYTKILGNIADKEWQEAALDAEIEHIYLDQWLRIIHDHAMKYDRLQGFHLRSAS